MQLSTFETPENEKLITEELKLDIDSKNVFKMILAYGKMRIIFFIENLNQSRNCYELSSYLPDIQKQDKNFLLFSSAQSIGIAIKKSISNKKYKISFNNEIFKLTIENDIFENNEASISIPSEKNFSFIEVFLDMKKELEKYKEEKKMPIEFKNDDLIKQNKIQFAQDSFQGSNILDNEEKVLISEWVDPKKPLKFNMVFSTNIDGTSSATTFHYYCDGVSPTVTIVMDTQGHKFGGYTTSTWNESCTGPSHARDQDAFIFNLTRKIKYNQPNKFGKYSIYRHKSYGPTFGGGNNGYNLYLANGCTGNTSSYTYVDQSYKTDNWNLINSSGSVSFQVSYYEVYRVVNDL